MNKEFIPYTEALTLKELGFDEPCFGYYIETKEWIPASYSQKGTIYPSNSDLINGWVSSPLYQQAFRWFREKHDLQASNIMFSNGKYDTGITRYKGTQSVWGHGPIYDTYEEAELACLKKLIEIVKNKQQ